jgi:hypothetical protein
MRSRNPVLKLGHSHAWRHQAVTRGRLSIQRSYMTPFIISRTSTVRLLSPQDGDLMSQGD